MPTVTDDRITAQGYRNVFRLPVKDSDEGALVAGYVLSTGSKAPQVVSQDGDYGPEVATGFVRGAAARRVDAPATQFPLDKPDYAKTAATILAKNPDCIVLAGLVGDMGPLLPALRAKGYSGRIVATQGFFDAQTVGKYAKDAEGLVISTNVPYYRLAPTALRDVQDYESRYGPLTPVAAYGYAAVQLVRAAVRRTGASNRLNLIRALVDRQRVRHGHRLVRLRPQRRRAPAQLLLLPGQGREIRLRAPSPPERVHAQVGGAGVERDAVRGTGVAAHPRRAGAAGADAAVPAADPGRGRLLLPERVHAAQPGADPDRRAALHRAQPGPLPGRRRCASARGSSSTSTRSCRSARGRSASPPPHVFVRDDPFVPIVAIGTGEPYALVISATWIELFTPDELRFVVGRELAHIAAGHTKLTSLLSANGRENAVVAVAFGAWLRADRVHRRPRRAALLRLAQDRVLGDRGLDVPARRPQDRPAQLRRAAARAGRRAGAADGRVADRDAVRHQPHRARWRRSPATRSSRLWSARFAQRRDGIAPVAAPPALAAAAVAAERKRYAGPGRRIAALAIDFAIISALMPDLDGADGTAQTVRKAAAPVNVVLSDKDTQQALAQAPPAVSHAVNAALGHGRLVGAPARGELAGLAGCSPPTSSCWSPSPARRWA